MHQPCFLAFILVLVWSVEATGDSLAGEASAQPNASSLSGRVWSAARIGMLIQPQKYRRRFLQTR